MRIKKTKNNEFVYSSGIWVRNFAKKNSLAKNINTMISREDQSILAENEQRNHRMGLPNISDENILFSKVVIVSDGYNFKDKHKLISQFPNDVSVIAVNGALRKWEMYDRSKDDFRTINVYLTNNPYIESIKFLPNKKNKYYPACVASSRTCPDFISSYEGSIHLYEPSPEIEFGYEKKSKYFLDDYRNPICAAIGLAYRFGANKVMLLSCDDAFEQQREGSMELENGLWVYPQQKMAENIIDANLFWLNKSSEDMEITNYSDGANYVNAVYIKSEEEAILFFKDKEDNLDEKTTVST